MRVRVAIIRVFLFAGSLLLVASLPRAQEQIPDDEVTHETLKFTQIYGVLEQNFMEPLDPDRAVFDGGIRGMLSALDPFSNFFDPEQFEQLKQFTQGKARGFGSVLYVSAGKILVLQTAEGSPARRAGLGPGDEIVEVNGTRIDRLDIRSLIELLQRARSQKAKLGVIRPGKVVSEDFELSPADVPNPTVDRAFLLKPGVAFLHVSAFDQKTPIEVNEAISKLGGAALKGALLDLRDNHGGVLDAAVALASLFLKPGSIVLTQRGRAVPPQQHVTVEAPAHYDFPLVLLVNGNTASAAEVFAAALQEHDRAVVAGEPSYGKGVVESVSALSGETGLALTTAQYFTPSGRSIQRPLPGTALAVPDKGLSDNPQPEFHTDNGRPVAAGGGITPDVELQALERDPWVTFLEQRGAFTSFASDYLTLRGKVAQDSEPDAKVLGDFRTFLERQRVRVPEEYWKADQDYLKLRIKIELFSLVFGLEYGEEVETRNDPQVQKAAALFARIPALLQPPAAHRPVRVRPKFSTR
ncbi:MAG: S41 family peptidase [Terriglobia bacterium]